jgi:cyclopropane fatty-acyl-phospholipid synthase-like methyltransferase
MFMSENIFSGADASMPLNWDIRQLEKAGFEVHSVENIGIHYAKTIDAWYYNWMSNKDKVIAKYGEHTFRMYQVFLGWSVEIAKQGSSSAYQITCYKNLDKFNRGRFIGKTSLGESSGVKNTDSVSSKTTTEELVG